MDTETQVIENAAFPQESNDPAYLAWRDAKVKAALKATEDGTATYKSIDDIAAKYGLDAR